MKLDCSQRLIALTNIGRTIGQTPLVELKTPPGSARVFAKLEMHNPYGTVKDRVAFAMISKLLLDSRGEVRHVLEYTGGSLGVALSKICKALELPLTLVVAKVSEALAECETRGECILNRTDPEKGFWNVIETAKEIASQNPQMHFLYQHENDANLKVHLETTGPEILNQLDSLGITRCDAWIAAIGTGGSLIGVHNAFAHRYGEVEMIAVSPRELPYGSQFVPNGLPKFAGSGGLGCGRKQFFVEPLEKKIVQHFTYSYDESVVGAHQFELEHGFQIGTSSAANWMAALSVAARWGGDAVVVTVFPSA